MATLERLAALEEASVRQLTLLALADVVEEKLGDARDAFRRRRRAHDIDSAARGPWASCALAAERHALWPELIEVLEGERRAARGDATRFVTLTPAPSAVYERAGEPLRAIAVLGEAVAAAPDDDSLHAETERIAAASGDAAAWRAVLSVTQAALHARLGPVRARLHERRARVLDERLAEPGAALDELLAAFKLVPRAEARPAIAALAARARRWEELLRCDGALYKLETTPAGKVAVLRRAARIVEDELKIRCAPSAACCAPCAARPRISRCAPTCGASPGSSARTATRTRRRPPTSTPRTRWSRCSPSRRRWRPRRAT